VHGSSAGIGIDTGITLTTGNATTSASIMVHQEISDLSASVGATTNDSLVIDFTNTEATFLQLRLCI